jgi:hypothetical protein
LICSQDKRTLCLLLLEKGGLDPDTVSGWINIIRCKDFNQHLSAVEQTKLLPSKISYASRATEKRTLRSVDVPLEVQILTTDKRSFTFA